MKKYSFSLLLILTFSSAFTQNNKIDSLLSLLEVAKEDTNKVRIYEQLFKKYYRPNPQKAIEYGKIGLKLATEIGDDTGISKLSNNIGVVSYYQSDHSQALEYYTVSLETAVRLNDSLGISKSYNNFGVVYFAISAYEEAVQYYTLSYEIKEQFGDSVGMAKTKNNIGSVLYEQGNYAEALENYLVSLDIKQKIGNREAQAQTIINIAAVYEQLNDYETTLAKYNEALEIYKKSDDQNGIASAYSRIGSFYTKTKSYDKAADFFEKAILISKKTHNKKRLLQSMVNLADIYFEKRQFQGALEQYLLVLNLAKEARSFKKVITINTEIAKVYNKKNEPLKAIKYLRAAESVSPNTLNIEQKRQIYQTYLISYLQLGQEESATKYLNLYQNAHDSLFSEQNAKLLSNMQVKYETKKKEKENELLTKDAKIYEQEKKVQKSRMFFLYGGIAVMVIVILIIMYSLSVKRKANRALNEKNNQLFQHREEIVAQNDELQKSKEEIEASNDELQKSKEEIQTHLEEISGQHEIVLNQKKHITDSIVYAQRIQQAALPETSVINKLFADNFIFYRPRDIVSGDFYWVKEIFRNGQQYKVVAVADCTGHGVPGAFVSMLGVSFLNEIVRRPEIGSAAELLNELRMQIKNALKQTAGTKGSKDGMDIALAVINSEKKSLQFAGAYNPLYIVRNIEKFDEHQFPQDSKIHFHNIASFPERTLIEIKADRQPIGIYKKERDFNNNLIKLEEEDILYFFSDGYIDQFNYKTGEKFKSVRFRNLILSASERPMSVQHEMLKEAFYDWKGDLEQIDDIIVMGVKI